MSPTYDVAIVGLGIVGAACADECSRGGLRTAMIEADVIGGGATAAGMGHLVVMDDSEAQFALTHYSQTLWQELAEELPADSEYEARGTIWVAADDEEMVEVRRKQRFYEERGVKVEVLDSRSLFEAEPQLRRDLVGGLLVPSDGITYPPCAARFLVERALSRGATLYLGRAAAGISDQGVELSDGTIISAGLTVLAAGCWSPLLAAGIEVQKRKGHLVITDRYPGFVRHQLVELGYLKSAHSLISDSVAFNVQPRITGQILIGSSRQYGVENQPVDPPILRRMIERAIEYLPGLAQVSAIRSWTGFRAATPDHLPLIGPLPDRQSLYLATGHEGLGITTSLGTAKLLADQILHRRSTIPIEPYLPARTRKEAVHV
jgi:glycine/D-amino acid oxidase-like deaminating enzyme